MTWLNPVDCVTFPPVTIFDTFAIVFVPLGSKPLGINLLSGMILFWTWNSSPILTSAIPESCLKVSMTFYLVSSELSLTLNYDIFSELYCKLLFCLLTVKFLEMPLRETKSYFDVWFVLFAWLVPVRVIKPPPTFKLMFFEMSGNR